MTEELTHESSANRTRSPAIISGPKDAVLLAAEWAFRQVYWRSPLMRSLIKRRSNRQTPTPQVASREELIGYLRQIGVIPGALVMAHTSVSNLSLDRGGATEGVADNSLRVALDLVNLLQGLVGESGTLVMPTNPLYKKQPNAATTESGTEPILFNPQSTPCCVGLANEVFRRQKGTQRSLYPHNTLAANGPLAAELLQDNLNESKPLPQGVHSGYYRFCQMNGLVVSIGLPLERCFTVAHAAEEARDEQWHVRDFFEERQFVVRHNGEDKPVTIRKTRAEFMMFSLCGRKLRRDLVRAGILHEGKVGTVRVDWAHSKEVFEFISERNRSTTYPYFGTSFVMRKALPYAKAS